MAAMEKLLIESGQPWCVVHGNGGQVKDFFEDLYPICSRRLFAAWHSIC
jgi:hypothetical protein